VFECAVRDSVILCACASVFVRTRILRKEPAFISSEFDVGEPISQQGQFETVLAASGGKLALFAPIINTQTPL